MDNIRSERLSRGVFTVEKAITSRVDDAAQRRSAARTIEDVRLSLDVLEQQVDTRIETS